MSMTHTHYDPWQQAADNVRGCDRARLKCSGRTGSWTLDGTAVSVDPGGLMITVIMPTALHGYILFEQNTVTGRRAASYENIAPGDEKPGLGWEPLTEFLCTGADQKHRGQLMTFQAASWGGRHAFEKLINPYLRRGQLEFPTCELSARDRGATPTAPLIRSSPRRAGSRGPRSLTYFQPRSPGPHLKVNALSRRAPS